MEELSRANRSVSISLSLRCQIVSPPLIMIACRVEKKCLAEQTGLKSGMCLDTTAECHGKTERRGDGYQIRMEKHVGTTHGKTAEVQEFVWQLWWKHCLFC